MALAREIVFTVAVLGGGGCGAAHEPAPPAARRERAGPGTLEAIEDKLAELEERLREARTAVRTARETKDSALRKLAELERTGRALRRQLERARRSGAESWTDIGRAIDQTMAEVETTTGLSED